MSILNTLHAKQGFHVYDAYTPQLDEMPGDIRRRPHQGNIAHLADLNHIIADQTVTSLEQLQSRFALSDAAFPHNQYSFTEHIDQHPMD